MNMNDDEWWSRECPSCLSIRPSCHCCCHNIYVTKTCFDFWYFDVWCHFPMTLDGLRSLPNLMSRWVKITFWCRCGSRPCGTQLEFKGAISGVLTRHFARMYHLTWRREESAVKNKYSFFWMISRIHDFLCQDPHSINSIIWPDKHTGQVDSSGCGGLASKFPAFQNYSTHRRMGAHV